MGPRPFLCRHIAMALLLAAGTNAHAGAAADSPPEPSIHSMFVEGSIDVGPDGKVQRFSIDHADAYGPVIRDMLDRVIPAWTFRPATGDGVPQVVHSPMYLRLEANPAGDGQFKVGIASAAFGAGSSAIRSDSLANARMAPPKYPREEILARVGAQVIAAVKIGRDGRVEDAVIEQTNLTRSGTLRAMKQWRRDFEQAAIESVRQWRFVPPTTGPEAARPYWSARIPVVYTPGSIAASAGRWQTFVPGPRQPVPWASAAELATAVDALPGGSFYPMTPALQLLTPLNQG